MSSALAAAVLADRSQLDDAERYGRVDRRRAAGGLPWPLYEFMKTQLNRGLKKRVMYIENKGSSIDGAHGRIGWVTFSKSGQTVYYRDKVLEDKRWWYLGKFLEEETGEEYWVSG